MSEHSQIEWTDHTVNFWWTPANIAGMREEIGIEKAKKEAPPSLESRVATLEEQVAGMNARFTNMQALLDELKGRLANQPEKGPPYPDTGTINLPLELPHRAPESQPE